MSKHQIQKLSILMSVMFLPTAMFKLVNFFLAVQFFTTWGLPMWLMHFIGAAELAGVVGLLMAQTRQAAALGLFLLMIGGFVTHVIHGEYLLAVMPIVYGAGLIPLMRGVLPVWVSHQAVSVAP